MRCVSCNANLSDFESTRKYESGEFVDLCNHCYTAADMRDIGVIERQDLAYSEDVSSEIEVDLDGMEEL